MMELEKINNVIARPVTIKILHQTYRWEVEFRKKYRHEAKLAARQMSCTRRVNLRGEGNDSASFERTI